MPNPSTGEQTSVRLTPGSQVGFRLRTIPPYEFQLRAPQATSLDALEQTLEVSADCRYLPAEVPCHVTWLIKLEGDPLVRRVPDSATLKVTNGREGKLELTADALFLGLVGKGKVGLEVEPLLAHCPSSELAPSSISFDNQASITVSPLQKSYKIGTLVNLTPKTSGLFSGKKLKLELYESDEGEAKLGTYVPHEVEWGAAERGPKKWRIGCVDSDTDDPRFDYREVGEKGSLEWGYSLLSEFTRGEVKVFDVVDENPRLLPKVERPTLVEFAWAEEASLLGTKIVVRGKVTGFDPALEVPFALTMCRGDKTYTLNVELGPEGTFEVDVCTLWPWDSTKGQNLSAHLRCKSIGKTEPFSAVIDYDPGKFGPIQPPRKDGGVRGPDDLTVDHLVQIVAHKVSDAKVRPHAKDLLPGIKEVMKEHAINTPLRMAHFLAQTAHEGGSYMRMTEMGGDSYFDKYEFASRLGNTEKGDGLRFKGRGLIQLTGRHNYTEFGKSVGEDFTTEPNNEKLAEHPWCSKAAGWYWSRRKLNGYADADDVTTLTKRINGGDNGLPDRQKLTKRAKEILGARSAMPSGFDIAPSVSTAAGSGSTGASHGESSGAPWMVYAKQELEKKVKEVKGSTHSPDVLKYFNTTSYDPANDEEPWCSAFANWCVVSAGIETPNSARAIDWKRAWGKGKDLGKPAYGALMIFHWHQTEATCKAKNCSKKNKWPSPGCTKGHVGFVVGKTSSGKMVVLGGNQDDSVKLSAYGTSCAIAYMVPQDYEVAESDYELRVYSDTEIKEGTFEGTR